MKRSRSSKEEAGEQRSPPLPAKDPAPAETESGPETSTRAPEGPDDAPSLTHLQHTAGNQAVGRMLTGKPLPSGPKDRMERAFGRSFDDVRIHTESTGDEVASRTGAPAAASGDHVFFKSGEFKPETPVGEALLAHELAHITRGHEGEAEAGSLRAASTPDMEADANRSMFAALSNLWLGGNERVNEGSRLRRRGKARGLLPSSCIGSDSTIEPPEYLGEHSLDTLRSLNRRLESLDALGPLIAIGTAGVVGFGAPTDPTDTVTSAAEALRGLPAIKRAIITDEVTLLLVQHGNDLNEQEKAFWQRILDSV